jgi:hypothetical protein
VIGTLGGVRRLFLVLIFLVAACSPGPEAPPIAGSEVVCAPSFCIAHPDGWDVEIGDTYISFRHPVAPESAFATIGFTNPEAVVTAAGETWPANNETVARSFWALLEETEVGSLDRLERLPGGNIRSYGSYQDGRMWALLVPTDEGRAVGVEVRGPNQGWEAHADVFFSTVELVP